MVRNTKEFLHSASIAQLMVELKKGAASVKQESDWVSEEEMLAEFGRTDYLRTILGK